MARDAAYRGTLIANSSKANSMRHTNAPTSIHSPVILSRPNNDSSQDDSVTPKAINGVTGTPGLTTGAATPQVNGVNQSANSQTTSQIPPTIEEGSSLEKKTSQDRAPRTSTDRAPDYFSADPNARPVNDGQVRAPTTPGETAPDASNPTSPADGDKDEKLGSSLFGKKFRMNFPKKLGRSSVEVKPAVLDEKSEESDKSEEKDEKPIQDNLFGTIQRIRHEYEQYEISHDMSSAISPSLLNETPSLHQPLYTPVLIQEERPDAGGAADLYRGTVSSVGRDADLIEKFAPTWLGDLLLRVGSQHEPVILFSTDVRRIKCRRRMWPRSLLYYYPIKTCFLVSRARTGWFPSLAPETPISY